MTTENSSAVEALLSLVTFPPAPSPADVLSAAEKAAGRVAAERAYYGAKANGVSTDAAQALGRKAFYDAVLALRAEGPITKDHPAFAAMDAAVERTSTVAAPAIPAADPYAGRAEVKPAELDTVGEARSNRDRDAAIAAGWSPADTVYQRGLRVVDVGVQNATKSRLDFEAKPLVTDMCDDVIGKIANEERADVLAMAAGIGMTERGEITSRAGVLPISRKAFSSIVTRLGYGGAQYLDKCPTKLRAMNVNSWRSILMNQENEARAEHEKRAADALAKGVRLPAYEPDQLMLRVRKAPAGGREIFAAVTPSYTPYDVNKVAEAIKLATPAGARGSVTYDGHHARFEVLFQTNVAPKHFVAGEFFRAGVIVRTADDGGGSARGSAVVFQNRCLNLLVIDRQCRELFRVRHVGSVDAMAKAFRDGYAQALASIEHFIRAWDYACEEDIIASARKLNADLPADNREALHGIFRGLLTTGAVELPGRDIEAQVIALVEQWEKDDSGAKECANGFTRASVVNAITRYAHAVVDAFEDPWAEDSIQADAAALLWGRKNAAPAPLPFEPPPDVTAPKARRA